MHIVGAGRTREPRGDSSVRVRVRVRRPTRAAAPPYFYTYSYTQISSPSGRSYPDPPRSPPSETPLSQPPPPAPRVPKAAIASPHSISAIPRFWSAVTTVTAFPARGARLRGPHVSPGGGHAHCRHWANEGAEGEIRSSPPVPVHVLLHSNLSPFVPIRAIRGLLSSSPPRRTGRPRVTVNAILLS